MGCYVDPADESKEDWLAKNGIEIPEYCVPKNMEEYGENVFAVCCVDNGHFAAAGIAFDQRELDKMLAPDFRPKRWFLCRKEDLREVSSLADMERVMKMESEMARRS